MALFIPPFRDLPEVDIPAMVRVVTREEMEWNRPVFKAPRLDVKLPVSEKLPFFAQSELPKFARNSR